MRTSSTLGTPGKDATGLADLVLGYYQARLLAEPQTVVAIAGRLGTFSSGDLLAAEIELRRRLGALSPRAERHVSGFFHALRDLARAA